MERLLDHLATYKNSSGGGEPDGQNHTPRNLSLFVAPVWWMTPWLDGMEPYGTASRAQGLSGKLAGDVSFQQLPGASP